MSHITSKSRNISLFPITIDISYSRIDYITQTKTFWLMISIYFYNLLNQKPYPHQVYEALFTPSPSMTSAGAKDRHLSLLSHTHNK